MIVRDIETEEIARLYEENFDETFHVAVPMGMKIYESGDGFVVFTMHGDMGMIHWAAIHKNKRRIGIGYTQFGLYLQHMKALGMRIIDMVCRRKNTTPQLIALKHGFHIFGITCGETEPQIVLRKEL
jgi:hypothetical protein